MQEATSIELELPPATNQSSIALVGGGIGTLIALSVLIRARVPAPAITVYSNSGAHPMANLYAAAQAVGQRQMRSDSLGHLAASDVPGLALHAVWQRRTFWPVLASLFDLYFPRLEDVCVQADQLMAEMQFWQRVQPGHVSQIVRQVQPVLHFVLRDEQQQVLGTAQHVVLALGATGLAWPAAVKPWQKHGRVYHAYQSHPLYQPGERVLVIGGGLAAVHSWLQALDAGAQVIALSRRALRRQRLNVPRCDFSPSGREAYLSLPHAERHAYLQARQRGTFPWRLDWEWRFWRARQRKQLHHHIGDLDAVEVSDADEADSPDSVAIQLTDGRSYHGHYLVSATGLEADPFASDLLRYLIQVYDLPVEQGRLLVSDDCTLPGLSQSGSIIAIVGGLAAWAVPGAPSFMGIKQSMRRLLPQLTATHTESS